MPLISNEYVDSYLQLCESIFDYSNEELFVKVGYQKV